MTTLMAYSAIDRRGDVAVSGYFNADAGLSAMFRDVSVYVGARRVIPYRFKQIDIFPIDTSVPIDNQVHSGYLNDGDIKHVKIDFNQKFFVYIIEESGDDRMTRGVSGVDPVDRIIAKIRVNNARVADIRQVVFEQFNDRPGAIAREASLRLGYEDRR